MVMSCLSKEPEGRPDTALDMIAALDMFSTASGEIRTREHRVPATPATPLTNPVVSAGDPAVSGQTAVPIAVPSGELAAVTGEHMVSTGGTTASDGIPTYAATPPRKNSKLLLGTVALLVTVGAAAAFLFSQRADETVSAGNVLAVGAPVADTTTDTATQVQQPPQAAAPESVATVAVVDSQARKDSARKRAQAARLAAAAAKADSQKQTEQKGTQDNTKLVAARRAVGNLLADANARAAFERGATRRGGPLGTRRKGDLQTQIDALQPFLSSAGLTYDDFKRVAQESGFTLFDEFGRMRPAAMQRFAAGIN
jgi:hypothetical protein